MLLGTMRICHWYSKDRKKRLLHQKYINYIIHVYLDLYTNLSLVRAVYFSVRYVGGISKLIFKNVFSSIVLYSENSYQCDASKRSHRINTGRVRDLFNYYNINNMERLILQSDWDEVLKYARFENSMRNIMFSFIFTKANQSLADVFNE